MGGKTQTVSILFSDVRNFTGVSEALGARETVSLLNEYFGVMVEVVTRHGGILDKYIGDAIMALFGAPFAKPEDADHALAVGNGMLVTLRELNGRRSAQGKQPIDIGVGIATGEVVLGNIGSPSRMEYTVIGDKVNLASRLEGANKYYHSKILLDETTVQSLTNGHANCLREIDLLRVKGKDRPVAVYESFGVSGAGAGAGRGDGLFRRGARRLPRLRLGAGDPALRGGPGIAPRRRAEPDVYRALPALPRNTAAAGLGRRLDYDRKINVRVAARSAAIRRLQIAAVPFSPSRRSSAWRRTSPLSTKISVVFKSGSQHNRCRRMWPPRPIVAIVSFLNP